MKLLKLASAVLLMSSMGLLEVKAAQPAAGEKAQPVAPAAPKKGKQAQPAAEKVPGKDYSKCDTLGPKRQNKCINNINNGHAPCAGMKKLSEDCSKK